jgi:hypothetical protein
MLELVVRNVIPTGLVSGEPAACRAIQPFKTNPSILEITKKASPALAGSRQTWYHRPRSPGAASAISEFANVCVRPLDWTLILRGRAVLHVTAHRYRLLRRDRGSEERIFEASNLLG